MAITLTRGKAGGRRRVSTVVISRNEGTQLRRTVENLDDTLPGDAEIVVVDDGSTDRSADFLLKRRGRVKLLQVKNLGVARARNLGARQARGEIIVFADAHIAVPPRWWKPLTELVEDPVTGAAAPAITNLPANGRLGYGLVFKGAGLDVHWLQDKPGGPRAAPLLPGCCTAMRRDVFEASGGWDEAMLQRGNVDNEGCVRLWMLGYDLMLAPDVVVEHKFRKRSPYPVGWPQYLHNRLRLAFLHLNPTRLAKTVAALRRDEAYGEALALLAEGDLGTRRRQLDLARVRNDDCYFERFGLQW